MMTYERRAQLQLVADDVRSATWCRDTKIREAVEDGGSLREVADAVGMSHSAIAKIVKRDRQ